MEYEASIETIPQAMFYRRKNWSSGRNNELWMKNEASIETINNAIGYVSTM